MIMVCVNSVLLSVTKDMILTKAIMDYKQRLCVIVELDGLKNHLILTLIIHLKTHHAVLNTHSNLALSLTTNTSILES